MKSFLKLNKKYGFLNWLTKKKQHKGQVEKNDFLFFHLLGGYKYILTLRFLLRPFIL